MQDLTKGLLNLNLSPEQARLLDRQAREQQITQQAQGAPSPFQGMMAQVYRTADTLQNIPRALVGRAPQAGVNELDQRRKAKIIEEQKKAMAQQKQMEMQTAQADLGAKKAQAATLLKSSSLPEKQKTAMATSLSADRTGQFADQIIKKYGTPDVPEAVSVDPKDKYLNAGGRIFDTSLGRYVEDGEEKEDVSVLEKLDLGFSGSDKARLKLVENQAASKPDADKKSIEEAILQEAAKIDGEEGESSPVKLSSATEKLLNTNVEKVGKLGRDISKFEAIEARIPDVVEGSGVIAQAGQAWRSFWGTQNDADFLRTLYTDAKNVTVINNLPPGVASDRDVALVMMGSVDQFANPKYTAAYMRGIAKLMRAEKAYIERMNRHISKEGNLADFLNQEKARNLSQYTGRIETYISSTEGAEANVIRAEQLLNSGQNPSVVRDALVQRQGLSYDMATSITNRWILKGELNAR